MGVHVEKDVEIRHAQDFRGYERPYMSETTADVYTICRVWTENPSLSADPFDFPVLSSAPQRSAGRLPPYSELRGTRKRGHKKIRLAAARRLRSGGASTSSAFNSPPRKPLICSRVGLDGMI